MITTNQIFKDLIDLLKKGLLSKSLSWQIIQSFQQTIGNIKSPYIMIHRISSSNIGFQSQKDIYNESTQKIDHTEEQIENVLFQIDAVYDRTPDDNTTTITGTDVLRIISRWLQSDLGLEEIKKKGYEILRITEVVEPFYKSVNELYQVNPHFELQLIVTQIDITSIEKIEGTNIAVKGV